MNNINWKKSIDDPNLTDEEREMVNRLNRIGDRANAIRNKIREKLPEKFIGEDSVLPITPLHSK